MSIQTAILKLKANSTGAFGRPAPAIKFIAAISGLIALTLLGLREPNNVPWYYLAAALLLLLSIVCVGFAMFARGSHSAEDISIRPKSR